MDVLLAGGTAALAASLAGFTAAVTGAVRSAVRWRRGKQWREAEEAHMEEVQDEAERINAVVDDLAALYRKVHYRHNIHCPVCGRFSRQADGWPAGTADCGAHGIGVRTTLATGSIPILAIPTIPPLEVPALPLLNPPSLVIEPPRPIPDDLSELLEIARV